MLLLGSLVGKKTVLSSDSAEFEVALSSKQCCANPSSHPEAQKGLPAPELKPVCKYVKNQKPMGQFGEINTLYT